MAHRSALPAESDITGERDAGVDEAPTSPAPGAGTTDRLAETTDGLSSARARRHMQTIGRYLAPPLTAVISSRLPIEATERASHRHQVDSNLLDQEHAELSCLTPVVRFSRTCRVVSLHLSDSHSSCPMLGAPRSAASRREQQGRIRDNSCETDRSAGTAPRMREVPVSPSEIRQVKRDPTQSCCVSRCTRRPRRSPDGLATNWS